LGGAASDGDDLEDEEAELTFVDVPDEVTQVILGSLDPLSLGRAACVCRAWRGMVAADAGLWADAVLRVFERRGAARVAAAEAALGLATAVGEAAESGGLAVAGQQLGADKLAALFRELAAGELAPILLKEQLACFGPPFPACVWGCA
jgi:hypothetical protein